VTDPEQVRGTVPTHDRKGSAMTITSFDEDRLNAAETVYEVRP